MDWDRVGQFLGNVLVFGVGVLLTFGLAYWAFRARGDRSARVGLYLLFGFPGFLLAMAGAALLVNGRADGYLLLSIGLGLGLPLLAPFRRLVSAVTPMDADSPVDMVGLCVLLAALGGFAYGIARASGPSGDIGSVRVEDLIVQAVAEVLVAYAAVGWWFARSGREATARLGIRWPSWRTLAVAIGFLILSFVLVGVVGLLTEAIDPTADDEVEPITEELTANVQNPVGAVVLGLSAGIGEEAIFRGALQPRFGIPLTSVLFGLVHAPQYGFSLVIASLVVVGVLLGLEAKYFGTTAAILTHAAFNAIVILIQSTV